MGFFKKKIIKEVSDGAWGHMVSVHGINVDTLSREMRCVEREGVIDGNKPVTLLRIFRLNDVAAKGIKVTGWETFDKYPELILYEGYLTRDNKANLVRKN